MERITKGHLTRMVRLLNETMGHDRYGISSQLGGYDLRILCKDGHGSSSVFNTGHTTKKRLYTHMSAYYKGLIGMRLKLEKGD